MGWQPDPIGPPPNLGAIPLPFGFLKPPFVPSPCPTFTSLQLELGWGFSDPTELLVERVAGPNLSYSINDCCGFTDPLCWRILGDESAMVQG